MRRLLEDRGRITESIYQSILVPVDRMKQKCFRSRRNKSVDRSSFRYVGSLFHACGAATEKALSPIRRRVHGTTRLPHDEARRVDRSSNWQPMSEGLRYIPACVQEATCEPTSTACTGSSQRLATRATIEELESRDHAA